MSRQESRSTRRAPSVSAAARTLRAVLFQLPLRAKRVDRALRTLTARSTALAVYADMSSVVATAGVSRETGSALLTRLANRPGWWRQSELEFVHFFGSRRSEIAIPTPVDVRVVSALVTRAEINTILGDSEWSVLADLHALAHCELERLL